MNTLEKLGLWYPNQLKENPEFLEFWGYIIDRILNTNSQLSLDKAYLDCGAIIRNQAGGYYEDNYQILKFKSASTIDAQTLEAISNVLLANRHEGIDYHYLIPQTWDDELSIFIEGAY